MSVSELVAEIRTSVASTLRLLFNQIDEDPNRRTLDNEIQSFLFLNFRLGGEVFFQFRFGVGLEFASRRSISSGLGVVFPDSSLASLSVLITPTLRSPVRLQSFANLRWLVEARTHMILLVGRTTEE